MSEGEEGRDGVESDRRHFKLRLLHLARAGSVRTCYDTRKHIK